MSRIWGIDLYDQNPPVTNWDAMRANGCRFAIFKWSMGFGSSNATWIREQAAAARAADIIVAGYHWLDPTAPIVAQADRFARWHDEIQPGFVMLDNEQWWSDWAKFYAYLRGEITHADIPHFSGGKIAQHVRNVMDRLDARIDVPKVHYTAQWFVNGYSRECSLLMDRWPLALASYIDRKKVYHAEWDTWHAEQARMTGSPSLPYGAKSWLLHQYTSTRAWPGRNCNTDVNLFNGDEIDWENFLNGYVAPPPVTGTAYKVTAWLGLRVRTGPGTNYSIIRMLKYDTRVVVTETLDGWGNIGDGWVSLEWLKEV